MERVDKITIVLQSQGAFSQAARQKAGLSRRGVNVVYPGKQGPGRRRSRSRTSSEFINFYDMGQIQSGGDWIDIPFSIPNTVTVVGADVEDRSLNFSEWASLETYLFTADPSDWKTTYRKLSYESAERYGLDVYDVDSNEFYPVARNGSRYLYDTPLRLVSGTTWTSQGLTIPSTISNVVFTSFGAFTTLSSESAQFKITNSPAYASPEVAFSLSKQANVYLTPDLCTVWSYVNGSEVVFQRDRQALQRSFWLDRVDATYGYPLFSYNVADWSSANKAALLAEIRSNGIAYSGVGTTPTVYSESGYPSGGPGTSITMIIDAGGASNWTVAPLSRPEGTFLGAVEQGGQMFYFWNKDNTSGIDAGRGFEWIT